ncbi:MAG: hypothetical protein COA58_05865 [Bacteroidetes bacterium]|nr:MAG: hypothetical protein COA58_05865 [Bacteroidota bacterium]
MKHLNQNLFKSLFTLISILWLKCIWDILHAYEVWSDAAFPFWFNFLFIGAGLAILPFAWWSTKELTENSKRSVDIWDHLLWLAIPLALICVSPVCYRGNIFCANHTIGTYIRLTLLIAPFILSWLYLRKNKKSLAITLLLIIGFLALIPNDGCNNQFNYWYVQRIGFSPLTYVPVVVNILLLTTSYFGKHKKLLTVLAFGVCIGCLIISFGHRLKVLW